MKKKVYIEPKTNVYEVEMQKMLAGSGEMNSNYTVSDGTDEDDEM